MPTASKSTVPSTPKTPKATPKAILTQDDVRAIRRANRERYAGLPSGLILAEDIPAGPRNTTVKVVPRTGGDALPATAEFFFPNRTHAGSLYLGSNARNVEQLYRGKLAEALKAGDREVKPRPKGTAEETPEAIAPPAEETPKPKRTRKPAAPKTAPKATTPKAKATR